MTPIGHTRTCVRPDHALLAPDGHVRTPAPGWSDTDAIVLISPRMGAQFSQWSAEMKAGGRSAPPAPGTQRFVYVTAGSLTVRIDGASHSLQPGGYAFVPAGMEHQIEAELPSTVTVLDKPYQALDGHSPPPPVVGRDRDVPETPLLGDPDILVGMLLPDDPRYDMAVNAMTFSPGAALPFVETHVMEHGLQMLDGCMVYRLGESWYTVERGDVIYMAPYCPQWAAAYGKGPARYLLYKDWNRDPPPGP